MHSMLGVEPAIFPERRAKMASISIVFPARPRRVILRFDGLKKAVNCDLATG
jgi:hypothetical protein